MNVTEKYRKDKKFRIHVNFLASRLQKGTFTPEEIIEASTLAVQFYLNGSKRKDKKILEKRPRGKRFLFKFETPDRKPTRIRKHYWVVQGPGEKHPDNKNYLMYAFAISERVLLKFWPEAKILGYEFKTWPRPFGEERCPWE